MDDDYYSLLGVDADAATNDIREAYRGKKSALDAKGDKSRGGPLNKAWNVLSDPYQRGRYDEQRARGEGTVEVVDGDAVPVKAAATATGSGADGPPPRRRFFEPRPREPRPVPVADDRRPRRHVARGAEAPHVRAARSTCFVMVADPLRPAYGVQRPPHRTLVPGRVDAASPSSATTRRAAPRASSTRPRTRPTRATRRPTRPKNDKADKRQRAARHGRQATRRRTTSSSTRTPTCRARLRPPASS